MLFHFSVESHYSNWEVIDDWYTKSFNEFYQNMDLNNVAFTKWYIMLADLLEKLPLNHLFLNLMDSCTIDHPVEQRTIWHSDNNYSVDEEKKRSETSSCDCWTQQVYHQRRYQSQLRANHVFPYRTLPFPVTIHVSRHNRVAITTIQVFNINLDYKILVTIMLL